MDANCKNKYNLDHVYCHTNESNYIRANTGSSDILGIMKENKQLKAMLLLHLDLIQEQSDQLMAKDKMIATLREEIETLKVRNERTERRLHQLKTTINSDIQSTTNIEIKKENVSEAVVAETIAPVIDNIPATPVQPTDATNQSSKYKICDDNFTNDSIIGESNGKFINKIILQRVPPLEEISIKEELDIVDTNYVSDTGSNLDPQKENDQDKSDHDNEDSFSCGSGENDPTIQNLESLRKSIKKFGVLTTKRRYPTREWEDEGIDEETNKDEVEALRAEAPNLEIPKWTIKEFTGLYSIEGTEDLSDDIFMKRHAKLEHDEKRRKKWDVQRIREQRTIERLKRRHCKDEIQDSDGSNEPSSFFPTPDSIKFIQITEDLPVQAFGDCIPLLPAFEFALPWQFSGTNSTELTQSQQSSWTFLKKRRRQYSQSASMTAKRSNRRQQHLGRN